MGQYIGSVTLKGKPVLILAEPPHGSVHHHPYEEINTSYDKMRKETRRRLDREKRSPLHAKKRGIISNAILTPVPW